MDENSTDSKVVVAPARRGRQVDTTEPSFWSFTGRATWAALLPARMRRRPGRNQAL